MQDPHGGNQKVWAIDGNTGGTVFGDSSTSISLWLGSSRTDVAAEKQHYSGHHGDLTDSGVLIGTYRDAQGVDHAALWFCS